MKKYLSASVAALFLCSAVLAQNYNAGPAYVNGLVYDASVSESPVAAGGNLLVGSGGTWLLNGSVLRTPRINSLQTEVVKFSGGGFTRSTGYVNGYAAADNQPAGFILPVGQSSYMPLTLNTALATGHSFTAAWYDAQPLVSAYMTDPGSGAVIPYYFLPGYYDLNAADPNVSVNATVPSGAIAGTHVIGTVDGTSFVDLGPAGASVTLPSGKYQLRFANSSIVLPVTLTAFTATKQGDAGLLRWTIAAEQNVLSYYVERSAGGRTFTAIGNLPSLGSATQEHSYSLTDAAPLKGANYYRLKMVEKDGKTSYSPTRLLNFDGIVRIAVYPNPVVNKVSLTGLESGMQVSLFNMQGQPLNRQRASGNTMEIGMQQLPAATYQIQVQDAAGKQIGSYRITKE